MNIYSVIVTYKNRFHLLNQVVSSLLEQDITRIIIIDNGSDKESTDNIKILEKNNIDKIKVIYFSTNTGSAYAYKAGMQEAYQSKECDFIWLLDDDNMPEENALSVLVDFWINLNKKDKESNTCLFSNRDSYSNLIYIAENSLGPEGIVAELNSFSGFHIKNMFKYLTPKKKTQNNINIINKEYGKIPLGIYGGMFFNKKIIDIIGYPDNSFFVYVDDYDYFSRFTSIGGEIFLIYKSKIIDLDKKASSLDNSPFRTYYAYRNIIHYQKKYRVTNKKIFFLNYLIYLILLYLGLKKNLCNIMILALKDGYNGKMGKNNDLSI